jgi:Family of unknown function (DUF5684)
MLIGVTDYGNGGMSGGAVFVWALFVYAVFVIPYYAIFTKAGKPGWAAFIPIYSTIVLLEVVGKPVWWILLFLIPIVNIVIYIIVLNDLSKSFGHGAAFTVGLIFLSWIFAMILGFGSSRYVGPAGSPAGAMAPPPPPPAPTNPTAPPA